MELVLKLWQVETQMNFGYKLFSKLQGKRVAFYRKIINTFNVDRRYQSEMIQIPNFSIIRSRDWVPKKRIEDKLSSFYQGSRFD